MESVEAQPNEGQGVQPDAAPSASPAPSPDVEHEVLHPLTHGVGGVMAVQPPGDANGGVPVGDKAPPLADLQGKLCPNCTVGVLYVQRYDPDALHEAGQDIGHGNTPAPMPKGFESGGAYDVLCANCGWGQSYALNPGKHFGKGR